MKLFILAFLVVMLLPVAAFCQVNEVETWYWGNVGPLPADSGWIYQGTGHADALARLWASNTMSGACNKQDWSIPVTIHASVAQWIEWTISGTQWNWRIRKPGRYGGDCITATVKSNQNVLVNYHDFADLYSPNSINHWIPIWYHVGNLGAAMPGPYDPGWTRAADMNSEAEWDTLYDSMDLHSGIQWKLWNMIQVVNCNSACEYEDQASISLKLLVMKPWIDPLTGNFNL